MKLSELCHLVWLNIIENKFKVVLTSIGIIVGAATIVLVIAVGRGGQMDVADQFANLSAASVEISTSSPFSGAGGRGAFPSGGPPPSVGFQVRGNAASSSPGGERSVVIMQGAAGGGGAMMFFSNLRTLFSSLSAEDAEDIAFFVSNVKQATISANSSFDVLGGTMEEPSSHTVAGVKPEYAEVSNLKMYVGDFITQQDEESKAKNCVLGYNMAMSMFDSLIEAYDSVITIDNVSFVVSGVLQSMGTVSSGISPDEAVYIPYSTGVKYLFDRNLNPIITVVAETIEDVADVVEDVEILLGESHPGATFTINDAGSKMDAALQSSRTLSMLLMAVAVIVFVVGGIGIMNVLFVSVKERTREIGVLKAVGMSKGNILTEFLLEATVISVFGGIMGNLLSLVVVPIAERLGVRMEPTAYSYIVAFLFAVVTGTVFGFYPALKASQLIPVQALGHE